MSTKLIITFTIEEKFDVTALNFFYFNCISGSKIYFVWKAFNC